MASFRVWAEESLVRDFRLSRPAWHFYPNEQKALVALHLEDAIALALLQPTSVTGLFGSLANIDHIESEKLNFSADEAALLETGRNERRWRISFRVDKTKESILIYVHMTLGPF